MKALRLSCLAVLVCAASAAPGQVRMPDPDPPFVPEPANPQLRTATPPIPGWAAAPDTEWTFHKTADGTHPDGDEQQII